MESFEILNNINVNGYIEKKKVNGKELSYLSWANAWAEVKKVYPKATYIIKKFGDKQLPYVYDENTGYMIFTEVTIENLTHEMWLFVMDGANKAMKNEKYEYEVKEYIYGKPTGRMITKSVESATMFDINTTIMRCLVKNLAMFGLGLYIYAGEDLPEEEPKERLLNKEEAEGLHRVLLSKGLSEEVIKATLLKGYKVDSTDKLTATQYVAVLKNLGDK